MRQFARWHNYPRRFMSAKKAGIGFIDDIPISYISDIHMYGYHSITAKTCRNQHLVHFEGLSVVPVEYVKR